MRFLYSLFIQCFTFFIYIVSPFSKKAKLWCKGRKTVFSFLEKNCVGKEIIWFHCASLGEFEQGKPLMEKIKQTDSNISILVTFFSPSGFENRKNDPVADLITYLPADTPRNAKKFIQIVNPKKVFFIKYEFWYHYMNQLAENNIPFYYVSAIFRKNQYFFQNYGKWFLNHLKKCSCFFVQNETSKNLLLQHGISNVLVAGDTRFDRVYAIAQQQNELDFMVSFKNEKKLLVAGSTWAPDEKLLFNLFKNIHSTYKLVIAPHLVEKNHIIKIKNLFSHFSVICYSEIEEKDISNYDVFIIDTIGILKKIYQYADISYIGGAFKTGLHNILEAAVYEKPVFFGPHYQKFNEAVEMVKLGAAFSISTSDEMLKIINQFEAQQEFYETVCTLCKNYITQNLGATERIIKN